MRLQMPARTEGKSPAEWRRASSQAATRAEALP